MAAVIKNATRRNAEERKNLSDQENRFIALAKCGKPHHAAWEDLVLFLSSFVYEQGGCDEAFRTYHAEVDSWGREKRGGEKRNAKMDERLVSAETLRSSYFF